MDMTETADGGGIPASRRVIFRVWIGALALVQAIDGLYALLAPRSFYSDFPGGRGWVEALPAYNEHLVRDVGALFLATAVVLAAAALYLERRLIAVALVSFLAFSIPHLIYHSFHLDVYDAGDVIANVITLAATVVVPIWLLWLLAPPAGPGKCTASGASRGPGVGRPGRARPARQPQPAGPVRVPRKPAAGSGRGRGPHPRVRPPPAVAARLWDARASDRRRRARP